MLPRLFTHKIFLAAECAALFVVVPGLLVAGQLRGGISFVGALFSMLGLTLVLGALDPGVSFRQKGTGRKALRFLPVVFVRAGAVLLLLMAATWWFWPHLLFAFPRERTEVWALVMLLYPLLSVVPQEYMFRVYFIQRYRPLFGEGTVMLAANALVFGWAHAFMLNWIAPLLSVVAGWLFADTWRRTRNLWAVSLEHALYGQIVFTVGIGWFFYNGSAQAVQRLVE